MVIMQTLHAFRVGFLRRDPKRTVEYQVYIFHPNPHDFYAPLALVVGDYVPHGYNLSRQWEFAGEEFWLARHLTNWPYMYGLWEPHP